MIKQKVMVELKASNKKDSSINSTTLEQAQAWIFWAERKQMKKWTPETKSQQELGIP